MTNFTFIDRMKRQHSMLKHLKQLNSKSKSTHPHLQFQQENLFLQDWNRLKKNYLKLILIVCLFLFQVSDKRTLKNGDSDGEIDGSSEDDDEQKTKIGKF